MEKVCYCPNCGGECAWEHRFCQHCSAALPPASKGRKQPTPGAADPTNFPQHRLDPRSDSFKAKTPSTAPEFSRTEFGLPAGFVLMNRYRIQQLLGMGGMGRVYLAADEMLGIPVAIKVLREVLSRDPKSVGRLIGEAKLSMKLAHPNIVRVHQFEDSDMIKFLVMEFVEGETLARRLAALGKLDEAEARRIATETCKGLEYAHEQKVIHRDIKPANIMLAKNGAAKIADFGIARECRDSVSRLTSQVDSGTLLYMSPAGARGARQRGRKKENRGGAGSGFSGPHRSRFL